MKQLQEFKSTSKDIIINLCNIALSYDDINEYELFKHISIFDNYVKICGKKKTTHPYIKQFNQLLTKYDSVYDMNEYFYDIQKIQNNKDAINEIISFIDSLKIL